MGWYRPEGAFWIDGRLVVVAGSTIQAWNPASDRWSVLVRIPQTDDCEGCGYSETAVWTGKEILLWGGGFSYRSRVGPSSGAAFDPTTGELRALSPAPIRSRWWHTAVWTGQEMIVWGGACGRHECRDGAAYDPRAGSWRRIADAPMGGYAHTAVWTGEEMVVWGGSNDYEAEAFRGFPRRFLNRGAAYDPGSDSWRVLEPSPVAPRGWHSAVWTGDDMIVWGGAYGSDAGAYNPSSGDWREMDPGPLLDRVDHSAVWTGTRMIVYGGSAPGGQPRYSDGAVYDPSRDRWQMLPQAPIESRSRHSAIWTGEAMLVWGGEHGSGSFADGAAYFPTE